MKVLFPHDTNGVEVDDVPLFPDRAGAHMSKGATIRAVRQVMVWLGEPLTRKDGTGKEANRFGEHVMRVAGAQFFARRGIELFMIIVIHISSIPFAC